MSTTKGMSAKSHHVAFSVIDLQKTKDFYELFGYKEALRWVAGDGSLTIVHMANGSSVVIEFFAYSANRANEPAELSSGNNLETFGIKHFGVQVEDLVGLRADLIADGMNVTEVKTGRTMIDFFFVEDPNGYWLEVVTDHRILDTSNPVVIPAGS